MAEIPGRDKLEAKFVGRLGKLGIKHRKELVNLLGNPPSLDNVPESFWEKVERETDAELLALLLLVFIRSGIFHGLTEAEARIKGREIAEPRAKETAKSFVDTTQERIENGVSDLLDEVERRIEANKPPELPQGKVESRIVKALGPKRLNTLAKDEFTFAQTQGGEEAKEELGTKGDDDRWINHPEQSRTGPCPICRPLHNKKREVWQAKFPSGPPAHPGCVCSILYANNKIPEEAVT